VGVKSRGDIPEWAGAITEGNKGRLSFFTTQDVDRVTAVTVMKSHAKWNAPIPTDP
jgi:hypothetical protein